MSYCVIVESGTKCAKIMSYLGTSYNCIASNGHIRILKDLSSISLSPPSITYEADPDKAEHIKKMKTVIDKYPRENIILGTDHDREGEAIAWHLCQTFDLPILTTKRIIFHEITKPALQYAIANPRTIDMNMVYAQQARQALDMIVGFKVSPLLWRLASSPKSSLSAGRCQTPALRLVYENEHTKKDADDGVFHHVYGSFSHGLGDKFLLNHDFLNEADLHAFMEASTTYKHTITLGEQRIVERACPKPFNTAALLQAASNRFSASAKDITAACQTLYQLGHITYMRTDSQKYSPVFVELAAKYISEQWTAQHVGNLDAVVVQEGSVDPHEAIRPTNLLMRDIIINDVPELVSNIYRLIWTNTVQSCMAAAKVQCQTISVCAPLNYTYEKTLELTLFPGFTAVTTQRMQQSCITPEYISSLNMKFKYSKTNEVDALLLKSQPFVKETRHFTEAGLINRLDSLGIGRPSTFSMLVDIIQTRNYVVRKNIEATTMGCKIYTFTNSNKTLDVSSVLTKFGGERNKLVITPLGSIVCEYLVGEFAELFSYDYTNRLEDELDAVAAGQLPWHTVCEKCLTDVNALVNPLMKVFYPLDDGHTLYFHTDKKTGKVSPLIRKANGNRFEYKRVKPDIQINFERLKRGEYTVADLAVLPEGEHVIGKRGDKDIVVKSGQYGIYAECGDIRVPMTSVSMPLDTVLLKLDEKEAKPKTTLVRELTGELSVRDGPHGHYIYFMTKKMKKPKFFDIAGFGQDYLTCDKDTLVNWIVEKYKIKLAG